MAKNNPSRSPEIQKQTARAVTSQRAKVADTEPSKPFFKRDDELVFGKKNFVLMAVGAALILVGLLLMLGGEQPDPNQWDPNIIYSSRIITLAPLVMLAGVVVEIYAIFKD